MLGKIGARARLSSARVGSDPCRRQAILRATGITDARQGLLQPGAPIDAHRGASTTATGGAPQAGPPAFEAEALACLDSLYRTALRLTP